MSYQDFNPHKGGVKLQKISVLHKTVEFIPTTPWFMVPIKCRHTVPAFVNIIITIQVTKHNNV
jgi:hypothetical protein